jgi:hypothetical protein
MTDLVQTVDPAALQLDKIANIHKPEMVPILRTIQQVSGLCRGLLLVTGALPWAGGPRAHAD